MPPEPTVMAAVPAAPDPATAAAPNGPAAVPTATAMMSASMTATALFRVFQCRVVEIGHGGLRSRACERRGKQFAHRSGRNHAAEENGEKRATIHNGPPE